MKIVVFGSQRRVGAWQDDQIVDVNLAYARYLRERRNASDADAQANERVPTELERFIGGGPATLDAAQEAVEYALANGADGAHGGQPVVQPRSAVKLHAPSIYRARIACAGSNYALHMAGMQASIAGTEMTADEARRRAREAGPWGFWKVVSEVGTDGDDVVYPARATLLDYEGEVAIVLGKRGIDIPAERAAEHIWGVTLMNDWSIRNDMGPPRVLNFNLAKNFDTSVTLGPCIVVGELDPRDVQVQTRVNGDLRQDYNSKTMTFSFAEFVELLSRDFTVLPGDVIAGGTGAGTVMDANRPAPGGAWPKEKFLQVGDEVEVSSPRIGAIRNQIVAKGSAVGA
jgi:2-keto-4-pentenoate hydratase/2-oxohepta-3-ene-1,7-dioic acid hydratase in catechol pathway